MHKPDNEKKDPLKSFSLAFHTNADKIMIIAGSLTIISLTTGLCIPFSTNLILNFWGVDFSLPKVTLFIADIIFAYATCYLINNHSQKLLGDKKIIFGISLTFF